MKKKMPEISPKTIIEIQREAREYISALKANKLTAEDIVAAENLMIFGYIKAMNENVIQRHPVLAGKSE